MIALALLALAACEGQSGTLQLGLVTAPGSTVLDDVTLLRVTVTEPREVFEARRTDTGFELAFDLEATGAAGQLVVEGFDDAETLRATGMSPPFPIAAIDAGIDIYMAPPLSIGRAPLEITPRGQIALAPLPYGAALVGGALADGGVSDAMTIYNAYDHSIAAGDPLPEGRVGPALGVDTASGIYIFGGGSTAAPQTGTLWRFDTTAPPAGVYAELGDQPALARTGEVAVDVGLNRFVVTGEPAFVLAGGLVTERPEAHRLSSRAAVTVDTDNQRIAIFLGADGIVRFRDDAFDVLAGTAPADAALAGLPGGKVIAIGGTVADAPTRDALVIDAMAGTVTTLPLALEIARARATAAATSRHLVVIGGVDAADVPIGSAEIFDAVSLAHLATVAVEPRDTAFALELPNDQILIGGGIAPSGILELFTPPPPPPR